MLQAPTAVPAPQPAKPKPPQPPTQFQEGDIARMDAAALVGILRDPSASEFQKAKACVRAGELGAREAVPALGALLGDEHLGTYARYGLEPITDPSASDALLAALPRLNGDRLIGVIHSIGKRRDTRAIPQLVKLMLGTDADLSAAATAALGSIAGPVSARELTAALAGTKGPTRMAVAHASLVCAERLLTDGKRDEALALYTTLTAPDVPKPVRLAAMNGIIREETSVGRSR